MFGNNIGPCALNYKSVELGETYGGTVLNYTMNAAKTFVDKTGQTARKKIVIGVEANIEVQLTEASLTQLAAIVPGADLSSAADRLALQVPVGSDLVGSAGVLILKPIIEGIATTDDSLWIYIPKASCLPQFSVPLKLEEQYVWKIMFEGHPVTADDIASGGPLYGDGYAVGDVIVLGTEA
jgi:hypothetical protein